MKMSAQDQMIIAIAEMIRDQRPFTLLEGGPLNMPYTIHVK